MPIPSTLNTSRHFTGINTYPEPGDMPPGALTRADGITVNAGVAVSRPGLRGLWASKQSTALYEILPYVKADGSTQILTVQGGKLWMAGKASTFPSLVPGSFPTLNDAGARLARLGAYGYGVDGQHDMIRFNLTTGAALTEMADPTVTPGATLTGTVLDSFLTGSWASDALSGAGAVNRLPNYDFSSTTGSLPTGYTGYGADPDEGGSPPTGSPGGNWVNMDTPAEGFYNTTALANDGISGDAARYASQFYVCTDAIQEDRSSASTLIIRLLGYSDAGGTLLAATVSREFQVPFSNHQVTTVGGVFSFAPFSTPILSYRVRFESGAANQLGGNSAVYVRNVVAFPFAPGVTAASNGQALELSQPQQIAYTGGRLAATQPGEVGQGRGAGGLHVSKDYGSPQDWSKYNNLALTLGKAAGVSGLAIQLAFRQFGSATRYYTNTFALDQNATVATCDITTVPESVRAAFQYLEVVLGGDISVPPGNGTDLVLLGPLTAAGNLSVGFPYTWYATEVNRDGDATVTRIIETNPSPGTAGLTATSLKAEGRLTLLPLIAAKNSTTTDIAIYRRGGVFPDDTGRKVAVLAVGANTITHTPDTSLVTWDHSAGIFVDNVPDSDLNSVDALVEGRAAPPTGANAICAWQNRIWVAKGSDLYGSWLSTAGVEDALYFTTVNVANDPNNPIKGFYANAGGTDNDPIQALIPYGSSLIVLKQRSVWRLDGFNADNMALQSYLLGSGVGCVAPRAACVVLNHIWFLGADGVYQFDADVVDPQSVQIEKSLLPRNTDGTPAITPTALARCAMLQHNRRLLLLAPSSGGSTNSQAWVWDSRDGGAWTRWAGIVATSGASLTSGTDSNDCYLAGEDGQLYALSGHGDIDHAGASPVAIAGGVTTGGFGQGDNGPDYWRTSQCDRMLVEVNAPAGTVFSLSASGNAPLQTNGAASFTQNWTLATGGQQSIRVKVPSRVRGDVIFLSVDWSSTAEVKILSLAAAINEGAIKT